MRVWKRDPLSGTFANQRGDIVTPGSFGKNTFGLTTMVDGIEVEFQLVIDSAVKSKGRVCAAADELLDKLAHGWRPESWV